MPRKGILAALLHNPIIQSNMHQISSYMYSTVSTAPSFIGSLTGISHTPPSPCSPPSNGFFPHFTIEPLISASLLIIPSLKRESPTLLPHYLPTSPIVPPHYSPTSPTLPPHSTHTPFAPSQLTTLPPFPAHLSPNDK